SRPLGDERMADEGSQATEQRRAVATVATYGASTYSGADAGARAGRGHHAHPPPAHSPGAPACRTPAGAPIWLASVGVSSFHAAAPRCGSPSREARLTHLH